jgi:rRNA maturation endonuclease Nob1
MAIVPTPPKRQMKKTKSKSQLKNTKPVSRVLQCLGCGKIWISDNLAKQNCTNCNSEFVVIRTDMQPLEG